jgi:small-conductance mechanosensitive channel
VSWRNDNGTGIPRSVRLMAAFLLLPALPGPARSASGQQPPAAPSEAGTDATERRVSAIPKTVDDIGKALGEVTAELRTLAPTTRPATSQPTTQPDGPVEARLDGWRAVYWQVAQDYQSRLGQLLSLHQALDPLQQTKLDDDLKLQLDLWQSQTASLRESELPSWITDRMVSDAGVTYENQDEILNGLSLALAQQQGLLAGGFETQRSELDQSIAEARRNWETVRAALEAYLKAADSDAARQLVDVRYRIAATRLATLQLQKAVIDQQEQLTRQDFRRGTLRQPILRACVVALRHRWIALRNAQSRKSIEQRQRWIASPETPPMRRIVYQLQLLRDEKIVELQDKYAHRMRDRFPISHKSNLEEQVQRDQWYWKQLSDSLDRRRTEDVLKAFLRAGPELEAATRQKNLLQSLLDESINEQWELEEKQESVLAEFERIESAANDIIVDPASAESIRFRRQTDEIRQVIRGEFKEVLDLERAVVARLTDAAALTDEHVELWLEQSGALYWAHLITRGPSVLDGSRYEAIRTEWASLCDGRLADSLSAALASLRGRYHKGTYVDLATAAAIGVLWLLVAAWAWRRCAHLRARGISDTSESADAAPPDFARRLRFHLARVGIATVPLLAVGGCVITLTISLELPVSVVRIGTGAALVLFGLVGGLGAVQASLSSGKPRYRLIPCSNTIAHYYRVCAYVVLVICIVFLVPSGAMAALDLTPVLADICFDAFCLAITVTVFVFLVRRDRVLGILPRTERGRLAWTFRFMQATYPFSLATTIALVVMQLAGYRALARYIMGGLAATVGLTLAGWVIYELVRAVFVELDRRRATLEQAAAKCEDSGIAGADAAADAEAVAGDNDDAAFVTRAHPVLSAVRWLLGAGVALASLSVWGIRPYEIRRLLDTNVWGQGQQQISLWRIGGALFAFVFAVFVSRFVNRVLRLRIFPRYPAIDRGAQATILTLMRYLIIAIGLYVALKTMMLDFGALTVLFGGLGLGLGLGLQPLVVNFISGLLMLFERHVKVGDVVIVHDKLGEVTKVSMRSTTVRTPDGVHLVIPNGEFINQKVENWTLDAQPIRGLLNVGVSYDSDPRKVHDLLLAIARAEPRVVAEPPPDVFFVNFGDSSLDFSLACWFGNTTDRWFGMLSMRYAIAEKFREHGIEIPFPQRTLSLIGDRPLDIRLTGDASPPAAGPRPSR